MLLLRLLLWDYIVNYLIQAAGQRAGARWSKGVEWGGAQFVVCFGLPARCWLVVTRRCEGDHFVQHTSKGEAAAGDHCFWQSFSDERVKRIGRMSTGAKESGNENIAAFGGLACESVKRHAHKHTQRISFVRRAASSPETQQRQTASRQLTCPLMVCVLHSAAAELEYQPSHR